MYCTNCLQNDIPVIVKQRKHLNKFTIDMDVARSRYQSVVKQNHAGNASAAKTDSMRDEMEDTAHRVEQCRVGISFNNIVRHVKPILHYALWLRFGKVCEQKREKAQQARVFTQRIV